MRGIMYHVSRYFYNIVNGKIMASRNVEGIPVRQIDEQTIEVGDGLRIEYGKEVGRNEFEVIESIVRTCRQFKKSNKKLQRKLEKAIRKYN